MPHQIEVQKIVLLPRFTTFSGARTFNTAPINVRAFASADISLWVGNGVGTSPGFSLVIQDSPDLKIWSTLSTINPTPGTEAFQMVIFQREWIRLAVTLSGTDPGFTGWCVGDFVTRAQRGN